LDRPHLEFPFLAGEKSLPSARARGGSLDNAARGIIFSRVAERALLGAGSIVIRAAERARHCCRPKERHPKEVWPC
jgi:hypothetical protein